MAAVVHVAQPTDGGVARFVLDLSARQAAAGWQVTVVSPPAPALEAELSGKGVRHTPWPATRAPGPAVVAETARLRTVLAGLGADLVHLHSSKAGLAGRLAIRGRRPTVFQPHAWSFAALDGPAAAAARGWERAGARWADVIVCVSEAERERGQAAGVRGDLRVVANGVDLERFSPPDPGDLDAVRAGLGVATGPVVVCVGRLCRQKGQDVLLAAWPAIRAHVPAARLVLVGDGPDRAALAERASNGVMFVGAVDDVRPWMTAADVVVVPSRWEGMPLALLEAMAMGRSIVATDVEGVREALGGGSAVVPPGDPATLAAAVVDRLLDVGLAAGEGATARHRAEAGHDAGRQLDRVIELSLEVLETHPPARHGPGRGSRFGIIGG